MALLEVKDLYKSFESLQVLRGISFSLEQGETLSVIGPSGGGKTTLLRCMNFLGLPDSGSISVNGETLFDSGSGKTLSDADIRRNRLHFGLVFQNFNLFPQYTALENVMLAPRLQLGYPGPRCAAPPALPGAGEGRYSPRSLVTTFPMFHRRTTICSADCFSSSLLYST